MQPQLCNELGVYRRRAEYVAGRCKAGLHEMAGYNQRRTRAGVVFCGECKRLSKGRWNAAQALTRYWRFLGLDGQSAA